MKVIAKIVCGDTIIKLTDDLKVSFYDNNNKPIIVERFNSLSSAIKHIILLVVDEYAGGVSSPLRLSDLIEKMVETK